MTYKQAFDMSAPARIAQPSRIEHSVVRELLKVLLPHPSGLRRWSVMRAIRTERERASRDVPQKFEADIERVFRHFCTGSETSQCHPDEALFYRPKETAGEVWAIFPDRAKAWLETEPLGQRDLSAAAGHSS